MCQTNVISKSIARLSRRSFNSRLSLLEPERAEVIKPLNADLNRLYVQLYAAYPEMTGEDCFFLSPYMDVLIGVLKDLRRTYRQLPDCDRANDEGLKRNISAIEELKNDIRNFKVNLPRNPRLASVLDRINGMS